MNTRTHKKIMPATGVIVGLALALASFAPVAFAQTSSTTDNGTGGTSTSTTNTGSGNVGSTTGNTTGTTSDNSTSTSNNSTGTSTTTGGGTVTNTSGNTSTSTTNGSTENNSNSTTIENNSNSSQSSTSPVQIMIMNHLCNTNIRNIDDFRIMQQGMSPVQAFAEAEANCPNSVLPGNQPVSGTLFAPKTAFDYSLTAPNGVVSTLANASFMNKVICESEFNVDFNHSGNIASTTCLDASHYLFPSIASSSSGWNVTVTESSVPAGYHFGTVLFTPKELDQNNDANSLVSSSTNTTNGQGTITLNLSGDNDREITLHVFNFLNGTTGTTTATSTNNGGNTGGNTGGNNGGNNNGNTGGSNGGNSGNNNGTTTNSTTTPIMDREVMLARINAILNILQRVQDIQSRIVDIAASLASPNWMMDR